MSNRGTSAAVVEAEAVHRDREERFAGWQGWVEDASTATDAGEAEAWARIGPVISLLKSRFHGADIAARANGGTVPEALERELVRDFWGFCLLLQEQIGDQANLAAESRQRLGAYVQREMLPYLLLTDGIERMYSKPRGYAGDYLSIAKIYRNVPGGTGRLGPLLERCFLETPAASAVRNRRGLLAEEIRRALDEGQGRARVTSLACGPAEEVFDVLDAPDAAGGLRATLVDLDLQALASVAERRDQRRLGRAMTLVNANLIDLALGRSRVEIANQHLVYSIGLIDYFEDRLVVRLLDWIYDLLAPGGRVILGNFHPRNPCKALMDYVLEWRLIHRTEADMDRLFAASRFGRGSTRIRFEGEGINLFAECRKD